MVDRVHNARQLTVAGLIDRYELWPHFDEAGRLRSISLTMSSGEAQHLAVVTLDRREHSTAQNLLMEAAHAIRTIMPDTA